MSLNIKEAKELISSVPRIELGFFPTPLHKLERLSQEFGVNLYIKRDDFSGKNLFGGNKTRKLEFLIGKAVEEKCEYVFTYGATQSNHAMQTVWAATANNLKPVLYLTAVVSPDENDVKANLLLNKIFDAEIHIVDLKENESFIEAEKRSFVLGAEHIKRLEAAGHRCMNIPMGGANEVGSAGYISGFAPGYECPNEGATEAIKLLAITEGILIDPVYTGKAFAGLIHDVRTGKIKQGSNVVFLHTGGATALFAEKEILGSLY